VGQRAGKINATWSPSQSKQCGSVLGKPSRSGHQIKANRGAECWKKKQDLVTKSKNPNRRTEGWPEPYVSTVYDRIFGDFPAKNTICTPYIYMVQANPAHFSSPPQHLIRNTPCRIESRTARRHALRKKSGLGHLHKLAEACGWLRASVYVSSAHAHECLVCEFGHLLCQAMWLRVFSICFKCVRALCFVCGSGH
jgi:hypothetical protein